MNEFQRIANEISRAGGMCLEVGGAVRDSMLGIPSKDQDVEVYNLPQAALEKILRKFGQVNIVGESFGVTKLTTAETEYDFSLPRIDNKIGKGHKGFQTVTSSSLTPVQAAARRDYTINSMGREALSQTLYDPYNGQKDLESRILRATSEQFIEDPLRVLRGFQFAARFEMTVEERTSQMAWGVVHTFDELPKERVFGEFSKWATKGAKPSMGLQFLLDTGWISLFPELSVLLDLPQDEEWHPEGNVFVHTGFVCDAMAEICAREGIEDGDRIVLMLAALCHDLGKAVTTARGDDGRWRSPGHAELGVPIAEQFLKSIGCFPSLIERILPLVSEHMVHIGADPSPRFVRRLSLRLGEASMNELILLIEADHSGRPPLEKGLPESARAIKALADEMDLQLDKPQPIVMGRHLIDLGMKPGPDFGPILDQLFERQLDGEFCTVEQGIEIVRSISAQEG